MPKFISPLKEQLKKTIAKFHGSYDVIILGAGPSGLSVATSIYDGGVKSILIIEKEETLGGVLNHCISDGFGEETFATNLTGKEYVSRLVDMVHSRRIDYKTKTTVLNITDDKCVYTVSPTNGLVFYKAKVIVYALGAHEVPRGSLFIPGTRPNGVFSAGTIQKMGDSKEKFNFKNVVIFGSNDVGLSASHTLTHNGVNVKMVVEPHSYIRGGDKNKLKSIDEHNIPLKLSHTIVQILGKPNIEKVVIASCDRKGNVIPHTEEEVPCDALLISMGLSPESDIIRDCGATISSSTLGPIVNDKNETTIPGIFSVGNASFIHDNVDRIVRECIRTAINVVKYIKGQSLENGSEKQQKVVFVEKDNHFLYVAPEKIDVDTADETIELFLRPSDEMENITIFAKFNEAKEYMRINKSCLHSNAITPIYIAKKDLQEAEINKITISVEQN